MTDPKTLEESLAVLSMGAISVAVGTYLVIQYGKYINPGLVGLILYPLERKRIKSRGMTLKEYLSEFYRTNPL